MRKYSDKTLVRKLVTRGYREEDCVEIVEVFRKGGLWFVEALWSMYDDEEHNYTSELVGSLGEIVGVSSSGYIKAEFSDLALVHGYVRLHSYPFKTVDYWYRGFYLQDYISEEMVNHCWNRFGGLGIRYIVLRYIEEWSECILDSWNEIQPPKSLVDGVLNELTC